MDVARASAIAMVLVDHWGIFALHVDGIPRRLSFLLGFLGVELFFVLSGFLIGRILFEMVEKAGRISPGLLFGFWVRRWLRTAPNYFLFLGLHALSPNSQLGLGYLFFCQNLAWPLSGSYPISWSLAVEEWFYFLLPLMAAIAFRVTRKSVTSVLLAASMLFAFSLSAKLLGGEGKMWESEVRKVVIFRLDSLMFGVLLAWLLLYRPAWFGQLACGLLAAINAANLLGLGWVGCVVYDSLEFKATDRNLWLFLWADLSFALLLAWLWNWRPRIFPLRRAITVTSLLAYSLYLCHGPVLRVLLKTPLKPYSPSDPAGILKVLCIGVLSFGLAALVYRFFERPFMNLRRRLPNNAEYRSTSSRNLAGARDCFSPSSRSE